MCGLPFAQIHSNIVHTLFSLTNSLVAYIRFLMLQNKFSYHITSTKTTFFYFFIFVFCCFEFVLFAPIFWLFRVGILPTKFSILNDFGELFIQANTPHREMENIEKKTPLHPISNRIWDSMHLILLFFCALSFNRNFTIHSSIRFQQLHGYRGEI